MILRAGLAYWAVVFALGFVLGTVRVLWLAPLVGPIPATLIELPVMLAASWLASGWLVRHYGISGRASGLAVGLAAFTLLMLAEMALAGALSGETPAQWLAGLSQPDALLGLAGQIVFALMPWWQVRRAGG